MFKAYEKPPPTTVPPTTSTVTNANDFGPVNGNATIVTTTTSATTTDPYGGLVPCPGQEDFDPLVPYAAFV